MKKIILFLLLFITISSCNMEGTADCFQSTGTIVEKEVAVSRFTEIIVWDGVQLIIKQGETRSVIIQSGENIIDEIHANVIGNVLELSNGNTCNLVRDYGVTKITVTTPELRVIRNSSGLTVVSEGLISFSNLTFLSEDPDGLGEYQNDGDFVFDNLDVNLLVIKANGVSNFFLKGKAIDFSIHAIDSDVRVEAADFETKIVFIYHRSTNKLIVNPIEAIRGSIVGLGDVIAVNHPPIVEVEEFYTGKLIFE